MPKTNSPQAAPIDGALLARLTGALGDKATLERICADFGKLYCEFLPDVIHSETGLTVEVAYNGHDSGLMNDLIVNLGDTVALADISLRNWCPQFTLACGNSFVIALMESLLGGVSDTMEQPVDRPLSGIELDLASMVFGKIGNVLRSGVNAPGGFEPLIEKPINAADRAKPEPDHVDPYAALIRIGVTLGSVTSELMLVVPQKTLLKTAVTLPKSKQQTGKNKEWFDQLAEQVRRSQVTLEARIRLQSLSLGTVSKLAPGDVIAFQDNGDVTVDISANGKELYKCEFGRSGEKYTVRVKDTITTDDEILRHLMG